jgi:hypothetical protein
LPNIYGISDIKRFLEDSVISFFLLLYCALCRTALIHPYEFDTHAITDIIAPATISRKESLETELSFRNEA